MRLTKEDSAIIGAYDYVDGLDSLGPIVNKCGQCEDIEEKTHIPFSQIASLKKGDKVYVLYGTMIYEGSVSSINYDELFISILVGKTFIDYMLFHQYGKNRHTPSHCWSGAWALTRKELE